MEIHTFPKGISSKVNVILESELIYYIFQFCMIATMPLGLPPSHADWRQNKTLSH